MQSDLGRVLTHLAKGELLRFEGVRGHAVAVFQGRVWITQNHDTRDIFVGAGETFALDGTGLVLVEAIEPAALVLFDAALAPSAASSLSHDWQRRARADRSNAIRKAVANATAALARRLLRWSARARIGFVPERGC